jgi:hypothetical protein
VRNPYLRSSSNVLPEFVVQSSVRVVDPRNFSCPQLIVAGSTMILTMDPEYTNATHCSCNQVRR